MANSTGGTITWNLDVDEAKFNEGLVAADAKAKAFSTSLNQIDFSKIFNEASKAFNGIADSLGNLLVKTTLVAAGGALLGGVFVKSAADLQQTSQSMAVLIGNTDIANSLFSQLARYANNTPFTFPQIAKAGQTLLGFGVNVKDVYKDITTLGDIAAATGADMGSLALVFGQVNATGHLMGQDALQLINNNIPITSILAQKLGISVQGVRDRMEQGTISAQLFDDALLSVTQKGGFAFQGTTKLAETFNGRLSTLSDTALEFGRNLIGVKVDPQLGLVIQPGGVFDRLSKFVLQLTQDLPKLEPGFQKGFNFVIDNGGTIVDVIGGIAAAFVVAKLAAIGFAIAAAINPFTLIAAAIVAVVGVLTFLQLKFDVFGKAFEFLKPVIDPVVAALGETGRILGDLLAPLFKFVGDHATVFKDILIGLIGFALSPLIVAVGLVVGAILVFPKILEFAIWAFQAYWNFTIAFGNGVVGVFNAAKNGVASAFGAIGGFIGNAVSAGANLIDGLVRGISNNAGAVINKIKEICAGALNAVKAFFGIHSPSSVMADMGSFLMQGLANGIAAGGAKAIDALSSVSGDLMDAMGGTSGGTAVTGSLTASGGASGGRSVVQNNTYNIANPIDLQLIAREQNWSAHNAA